MDAAIRLGSVSLNCPDPRALASFYTTLLDKEIVFDSDTFVAIQLDNMFLSMQRVDDFKAPTWPTGETPSHIHLDFAVSDLDASQATALAAGATLADAQPNLEHWRVFVDPVGNPFCLTTLIPS